MTSSQEASLPPQCPPLGKPEQVRKLPTPGYSPPFSGNGHPDRRPILATQAVDRIGLPPDDRHPGHP